jgi:hypothetical protein
MIRKVLFVIFIYLFNKSAGAQEVIFGSNDYIEYQVGTLPIVISVSHGGYLEPAEIPDRLCNDAVYTTDAYTIETALEIKNSLYNKTGCYPHLIICYLKRSKLDCNRNLSDGACGNSMAEIAWNEFHKFIADARNTANQDYDNNTFFIDLHGHGNSIQRIELGYLLYDYELEKSDDVLNSNQFINYSSIKNMVFNNNGNLSHSQLLRGPKSLGSLLSNQNYPSVPSELIPYPGTNTNYFSGGYITANHTCNSPGVNINGLQMELNFSGIRNSADNREKFANGFVESIIEFFNTHFNISWNFCTPLFANEWKNNTNADLLIFPNPAKKGGGILISNTENNELNFVIFSISGKKIKTGKIINSDYKMSTDNLDSGIYILKFFNDDGKYQKVTKLIIE